MSEFCLMPKDIYESLNTLGLTEGGKKISLANNATILPLGIAEGVFTKILGIMISTDYLVIECAGEGQITLGRSLLELLGATIDVGKGTMHLYSPPNNHIFPKVKNRSKKGKGKKFGFNASSFENT
uniref:Uncharacterized protein n=1 Tax=Avena sativa TaxID=4498 RepID=A0ACD5VNC0_AVESA